MCEYKRAKKILPVQVQQQVVSCVRSILTFKNSWIRNLVSNKLSEATLLGACGSLCKMEKPYYELFTRNTMGQ